MPAKQKPVSIQLYMYNVYFGDCFLLVFQYPGGAEKFVLIDFGSTGKGKHAAAAEADEEDKESTGSRLLRVAEHIEKRCGGQLDVVVATHRHKDHIYGFGLKKAGAIIAGCHPKAVIQPWTENPEDERDLGKEKPAAKTKEFFARERSLLSRMFRDMDGVARTIEAETMHLADGSKFTKTVERPLKERILFAADDNQIKNRAAVENLRAMGPNHYVSFGYNDVDWEELLPGVDVDILGPPSLEQTDTILAATNKSDEFWSLRASANYYWGVQAATGDLINANIESGIPLFGEAKAYGEWIPPNARWFIRQLRSLRASQLFAIVRYVDGALNNTSVIMTFEAGDQILLFPGDAQIENWRYAMEAAKKDGRVRRLLTKTSLYKVGHHGSRNATPKSLWEDFERRSKDKKSTRLNTVVSTMKGKHGESADTEVPLPVMVEAMTAESNFFTTEEIDDDFVRMVEIPIKY